MIDEQYSTTAAARSAVDGITVENRGNWIRTGSRKRVGFLARLGNRNTVLFRESKKTIGVTQVPVNHDFGRLRALAKIRRPGQVLRVGKPANQVVGRWKRGAPAGEIRQLSLPPNDNPHKAWSFSVERGELNGTSITTVPW